MTLEEIKQAVEAGKIVHWKLLAYTVIKDDLGQWMIKCEKNNSCIGLTWLDNVTLNGRPVDFYMVGDGSDF